MVRGMAFVHRDKHSATRGANFSCSTQRPLDRRAVIRDLDNLGG